MARIPRAASQERVEVTAPSPISPNAFTAPGVALTEFGSSFQQVGAQMGRVRDIRRSMFAESNAIQRINVAQFNAKNDPNPDNLKIYLQELDDIQNGATAGLEEGFEKFKLQSSINNSIATAKLKIIDFFNQKNVIRAKEAGITDISAFKFHYWDAESDVERKLIKKQANDRIDQLDRNGIWDPGFARQVRESLDADWAEGEFNRDLFGDPKSGIEPMPVQQIEDKLEAGAYNFSLEKRIDAEARLKKATANRKAELAQIREEAHTRNWSVLVDGITNGDLGYADAVISFGADQISAEGFKEIVLWLETADVEVFTDEEIALSLMERGLTTDEKLLGFGLTLLKAVRNGELSRPDFLLIKTTVNEDFKRAKALRVGNTPFKRAKMAAFLSFKLLNFSPNNIYNMSKELFTRTQDEGLSPQQINEIRQDILINQTRNANPGLAFLEDVPNSIVEADGASRTIRGGKVNLPPSMRLRSKIPDFTQEELESTAKANKMTVPEVIRELERRAAELERREAEEK